MSDPAASDERARPASRGAAGDRAERAPSNGVAELMLSALAHDLRSPLNAIRLSVQMLREEGERDGWDVEPSLALIERAVWSMERLTQDLEDARAIELGTFSLDMRELDLAALVRQAAETGRALARDRDVDLEASVADVRPVVGDLARLDQAVDNLVSNAIRHSPPGGRVDLELAPANGAARVIVRDQGEGIPDEVDRRKIFDPFVRGRNAVGGGRGLGLAITRAIVEGHGGAIWIEPTERGAEFRFTIPTAPEHGALPSGAEREASLGLEDT